MKTKLFFFFLLLSLSVQMMAMAGDGYTLVWSDEFNGSSLNANAWNIETGGGGWGNGELQNYTANNISVSNGCLVITSRKERDNTFTSGRLTSHGKAAFKYGKVEARIKMPHTANGLWPAYWMMGNDISTNTWPSCGEIDIVESGNTEGINNGTQDRFFDGATHWGTSWQNHPCYAKGVTNPYSIQDDQFHTFTAIWTDTNISLYLDLDKYPNENPYYSMNITDYSNANACGNFFHKQFFILFNLAVGGNLTSIYNANGITALPYAGSEKKMYVDYVRVYQKTKDCTLPAGYKGDDDITVSAAPVPTKSAANVKSLYSDAYTSVAPSWAVGQWYQSTTTVQKNLSGTDHAYYNTKFNYLGFNYGSNGETVDMSGMDYLHLDIYPLSDMTINVYPITKYSNGTTNDTQKKAVNLTANKWNQVDLSVADFKAMGLNMSTNFQIKLDGGNGSNNFFLDNIYFWKEPSIPSISAAPVPTKSAANVKSLYSDTYTSVSRDWSVGSWYQSTKTTETNINGNNAYYNTNFNYLGFQFCSGNQTLDMSNMDYLHMDIYPTSSFTINIYPITKRADGSTDDTKKIPISLTANKWNSIDLSVADFRSMGLDVSKSYQFKFDGGNGMQTFYLDNIYYWKGIPAAPTPLTDAGRVKSLYSDAYNTVAANWEVGSWWQSTKTVEMTLAEGDKAYCNTNFNYLGFQFGGNNDIVDASQMKYLHMDIYPKTDMTVNVYPITKWSNGSTNDTKWKTVSLTKNHWNSIDMSVSEFQSLGLDMSKNFQFKFDGGNGTQTFYLDNIYYWTDGTSSAKLNNLTDIPGVDADSSAMPMNIYTIDGRMVKHDATSLEGLQKGIYIVHGNKVVVK